MCRLGVDNVVFVVEMVHIRAAIGEVKNAIRSVFYDCVILVDLLEIWVDFWVDFLLRVIHAVVTVQLLLQGGDKLFQGPEFRPVRQLEGKGEFTHIC